MSVKKHSSLVQELRRSHTLTLTVLVLVLLVSLGSSGYLILVGEPRLATYVVMARQSRDGTEAMLNQETGLRGWLATGDRLFLEPYTAGRSEAQQTFGSLLGTSRDDDAVSAAVAEMLVARLEWNAWARAAAAWVVSEEERVNGDLSAFLMEGKRLFDIYRVADTASTDQIVAQRTSAQTSQRRAQYAVLAAYLSLLLGAGVVALRRRRDVKASVVRPTADLLRTIDDLGNGVLASRFRPRGVHELDAIGSALGALAGELSTAREEATVREARLAFLADRFETVVRVGREISGSLSIRYVSETVVTACSELLEVPTTLWVREDDLAFHAAARSTDPHGTAAPQDPAPELVKAVARDRTATSLGSRRAYPLEMAGVVVGVLEASTTNVNQDSEQVLLALLSTAAAALESARLHSHARDLADHDALTGLPNRRRFETDMATEWQRAIRYHRPLSLVMLDLDHFKLLNDRHGHLVGDQALRQASHAIASALRSDDIAYRYGGEEFAIVLPETRLEDAVTAADRIRVAVEAATFDDPALIVTASAGVAELQPGMTHHTDLVGSADVALYRAKQAGRNTVEPRVRRLSTLP